MTPGTPTVYATLFTVKSEEVEEGCSATLAVRAIVRLTCRQTKTLSQTLSRTPCKHAERASEREVGPGARFLLIFQRVGGASSGGGRW